MRDHIGQILSMRCMVTTGIMIAACLQCAGQVAALGEIAVEHAMPTNETDEHLMARHAPLPNAAASAWIGFYRVESSNQAYLAYTFLNNLSGREYDVPIPTEPGRYNFRVFADDGYDAVAVSAPITIDDQGGIVIAISEAASPHDVPETTPAPAAAESADPWLDMVEAWGAVSCVPAETYDAATNQMARRPGRRKPKPPLVNAIIQYPMIGMASERLISSADVTDRIIATWRQQLAIKDAEQPADAEPSVIVTFWRKREFKRASKGRRIDGGEDGSGVSGVDAAGATLIYTETDTESGETHEENFAVDANYAERALAIRDTAGLTAFLAAYGKDWLEKYAEEVESGATDYSSMTQEDAAMQILSVVLDGVRAYNLSANTANAVLERLKCDKRIQVANADESATPADAASTTEPAHGTRRADGMVWSAGFGAYIDAKHFDELAETEYGQISDQNRRDQERLKDWDDYYARRQREFGLDFDSLYEDYRQAKADAGRHAYAAELLRGARHSLPGSDLFAKAEGALRMAAERGASDAEMREIIQTHIRTTMGMAEYESALQEEIESRQTFYIGLSRATVSALESSLGLSQGALAQGIIEGSAALLADGGRAGLMGFARNVLPVNAAEAVATGGGFGAIAMGVLADLGVVANIKGGRLGFAHETPLRNALATGIQVDADKAARLRQAYFEGVESGQKKVKEFIRIAGADTVDPYAMKKLLADIQCDKNAIDLLNLQDVSAIDKFKRCQKHAIYDPASNDVRRHLAKALGCGTDDIACKTFSKNVPDKSGRFTKVDQDLDLSFFDMRGDTPREIPPTQKFNGKSVDELYADALYKAVDPRAAPSSTTAAELMQRMDQNITYSRHVEAFGASPRDFDTMIKYPDDLTRTLADADQIVKCLEYKSQHFFRQSADLVKSGNFNYAQRIDYEGMRQMLKNYDRFYLPRLQALRAADSPVIARSVAIMRQIGAAPGQGLSPGEARMIMNNMGVTPEIVNAYLSTRIGVLFGRNPPKPAAKPAFNHLGRPNMASDDDGQ